MHSLSLSLSHSPGRRLSLLLSLFSITFLFTFPFFSATPATILPSLLPQAFFFWYQRFFPRRHSRRSSRHPDKRLKGKVKSERGRTTRGQNPPGCWLEDKIGAFFLIGVVMRTRIKHKCLQDGFLMCSKEEETFLSLHLERPRFVPEQDELFGLPTSCGGHDTVRPPASC